MKNQLLVALVFICTATISTSCTTDVGTSSAIPTKDSFAAPTPTSSGLLNLVSRACYFDDVDSVEKRMSIKIDAPSVREVDAINSIMGYVGLTSNFKIYRGEINNAMATIVNNQRVIVYNKDLFTRLDNMDSSYWSTLFILAHEIGHHLAGNTIDTVDLLNIELEADRFAGATLYRMGADSIQVMSAISSRFISNVEDTKTHPAKSKRIAAVKASWYDAAKKRFSAAIPPPPNDDNLHESEFNELELYGAYYEPALLDSVAIFEEQNRMSSGLHGIILNVEKIPQDETREIEIRVLVTKVDSAHNRFGFTVNQRLDLQVNYTPYKTRPIDFDRFFVGGRRFVFRVIQKDFAGGMRSYFVIGAAKE